MIYLWSIYVDGQLRATVGAMTEQSAINKYFNQFGGASRYSGISRDSIEAVRA